MSIDKISSTRDRRVGGITMKSTKGNYENSPSFTQTELQNGIKITYKKKSEIQDTNFSLSSIIKLTDDEDNSAAAGSLPDRIEWLAQIGWLAQCWLR